MISNTTNSLERNTRFKMSNLPFRFFFNIAATNSLLSIPHGCFTLEVFDNSSSAHEEDPVAGMHQSEYHQT